MHFEWVSLVSGKISSVLDRCPMHFERISNIFWMGLEIDPKCIEIPPETSATHSKCCWNPFKMHWESNQNALKSIQNALGINPKCIEIHSKCIGNQSQMHWNPFKFHWTSIRNALQSTPKWALLCFIMGHLNSSIGFSFVFQCGPLCFLMGPLYSSTGLSFVFYWVPLRFLIGPLRSCIVFLA